MKTNSPRFARSKIDWIFLLTSLEKCIGPRLCTFVNQFRHKRCRHRLGMSYFLKFQIFLIFRMIKVESGWSILRLTCWVDNFGFRLVSYGSFWLHDLIENKKKGKIHLVNLNESSIEYFWQKIFLSQIYKLWIIKKGFELKSKPFFLSSASFLSLISDVNHKLVLKELDNLIRKLDNLIRKFSWKLVKRCERMPND